MVSDMPVGISPKWNAAIEIYPAGSSRLNATNATSSTFISDCMNI